MPIARQASNLIDQVPELLNAIGRDDVREFTPSPEETREVCRRQYRTRRTLLLQYDNDSIDETDKLASVLGGVETGGDEMMVVVKKIEGTHITPLGQDAPLGVLPEAVRGTVQEQLLATTEASALSVISWLDDVL